ncbi:hypothetical protein ACIBTV_16815 [Micromonospora sp. NPDC049366]|uniref:hypothetical protein n=1 Tax=Micromonospora sp. NPDC049366 TaxID=3364271 RepID=UPI0037938AB5
MLGACQVGKAWAAVDGQGRFATVAVLDGVAASDQRWRDAFANAVNALAQADGGHTFAASDFSAAHPWVAYTAEQGHAPQRLFQSLGLDYQPVPDLPISAPPVSGAGAAVPQQVSGPPQQVSGPPRPASGVPELVSEMPQLPWAVHTTPVSGQPAPTTPQPVSGAPTSPTPTYSAPSATEVPQPVSAAPQSPAYGDAAGGIPPYDPFASTGRRIAPVRREPKRRPWPLLVGALALALVAGTAGFFVGRSGGAGENASPEPSASASLLPFEATQLSMNRGKFEGPLAPLAEPWLSQVGGCAAYDEVGAPKLPKDEKQHVFCQYGGAFLHFVLYPEKEPKDAARLVRQQLNLSGGSLAAGLRAATRTDGVVSGSPGSYIEYAFKLADGRAMCGIWWDRDDTFGAFYVEALCEAGINGNWDALRDLWRRGS